VRLVKKEIFLRTGFLILLTFFIVSLPEATDAVSASVYSTIYEMPVSPAAGNCSRCHNPAAHPMNNCDSCHDQGQYEPGAVLTGGHGGLNVSDLAKRKSTAPVGSCMTCHTYTNECMGCHPSYYGAANPVLTPDPNPRWPANYSHNATRIDNFVGMDKTYKCEMCHIQTWWPSIPQHNLATFGSVYNHSSSISGGCLQCHYTPLTTEHYQRTGPTGQPLDCFTCHSNPAVSVQLAVKNNETGCGGCHNQAHNLNLTSNVPADIPLFSGFQWTPPVPLATWAGESWAPAEFLPDGYIMISNRRSDVTGDQVWSFYKTRLGAKGWSPVAPEPAPGANNFKVKFTKGSAGILLWYYGGIYHTNDPALQQGARIEIIY